jgi:hypothetical protein
MFQTEKITEIHEVFMKLQANSVDSRLEKLPKSKSIHANSQPVYPRTKESGILAQLAERYGPSYNKCP